MNLPQPLYCLYDDGVVCVQTTDESVLALFSGRREYTRFARGTFMAPASVKVLVTGEHLTGLLSALPVRTTKYAIDPPNQPDVSFRAGEIEELRRYARLVEEGRVG